MSNYIKKLLATKKLFPPLLFFRKYPSLPYILKWTSICLIIGACIGSASAFFLQTLSWVTDYRENNVWLIALLPIGGFLIGLLYYRYGKSVEGGNNLLLDLSTNPNKPFHLKWQYLFT